MTMLPGGWVGGWGTIILMSSQLELIKKVSCWQKTRLLCLGFKRGRLSAPHHHCHHPITIPAIISIIIPITNSIIITTITIIIPIFTIPSFTSIIIILNERLSSDEICNNILVC